MLFTAFYCSHDVMLHKIIEVCGICMSQESWSPVQSVRDVSFLFVLFFLNDMVDYQQLSFSLLHFCGTEGTLILLPTLTEPVFL
jgi:hypothetical protein